MMENNAPDLFEVLLSVFMEDTCEQSFLVIVAQDMSTHIHAETINHDNLTTLQKYIKTCYNSMTELMNACDQIELALVYLPEYEKRHTNSGILISRHKYIRYQIENIHFRIVSSYDRALRLTNEFCQLGLPKSECRESTVAKNGRLNPGVKKALREIKLIVDHYREARNATAHSTSFEDDGFRLLNLISVLEKRCGRLAVELGTLTPDANQYIEEKLLEFHPVHKALDSAVSDLFDSLRDTYLQTRDVLSVIQ
jgi:hypothetical protein